jgi:hypothetical protein
VFAIDLRSASLRMTVLWVFEALRMTALLGA